MNLQKMLKNAISCILGTKLGVLKRACFSLYFSQVSIYQPHKQLLSCIKALHKWQYLRKLHTLHIFCEQILHNTTKNTDEYGLMLFQLFMFSTFLALGFRDHSYMYPLTITRWLSCTTLSLWLNYFVTLSVSMYYCWNRVVFTFTGITVIIMVPITFTIIIVSDLTPSSSQSSNHHCCHKHHHHHHHHDRSHHHCHHHHHHHHRRRHRRHHRHHDCHHHHYHHHRRSCRHHHHDRSHHHCHHHHRRHRHHHHYHHHRR